MLAYGNFFSSSERNKKKTVVANSDPQIINALQEIEKMSGQIRGEHLKKEKKNAGDG